MRQVNLRFAESFRDRLLGLLFRAPLGPGQGLLIAPCGSVHTFGMRYAIDVVFLDRRGRILKIVHRLVPWRAAACAGADQVIELAAGEAARLGLVRNQRMRLTQPHPHRQMRT